MINLKYVIEDEKDADEDRSNICYLPMKIGEFVPDPNDNAMKFSKSMNRES